MCDNNNIHKNNYYECVIIIFIITNCVKIIGGVGGFGFMVSVFLGAALLLPILVESELQVVSLG